MDKVVVTVFLLIAGIVCSLAVFNAIYPAINRSASAISTMSSSIDDRIKSQIEIIQTESNGSNIYVWVKNVGASRIVAIDSCDVFLEEAGTLSHITYGGVSTPRWEYTIEGKPGEDVCDLTDTIKITIYLSSAPSGSCIVKVVLPNGISEEHQFSI